MFERIIHIHEKTKLPVTQMVSDVTAIHHDRGHYILKEIVVYWLSWYCCIATYMYIIQIYVEHNQTY